MVEKLLHVSDSLISAEQHSRNDETPLGGLSPVVERARERNVDAVIHSGNLFRRPEPDQQVVEALAGELETLSRDGIPFLVVEGKREQHTDDGAVTALVDRELAHKPTADPTLLGDVAVYGIDHVDTEEALLESLDALEPASQYTYNIVVVQQSVWPPARKQQADISAFDLLEGTDVHVDMVLAGGFDEPREWQHDEFEYSVVYSGSTNPTTVSSGKSPQGTVVHADAEGASRTALPLVSSAVNREVDQLRAALELQPSDEENLDTETLVDLYGLAARARSVFDQRRKEIRDELLARLDEDGRFDGQYASVERRTNRRRNLKEERDVIERLEREGVDPADVMTLDPSLVREVVDETGLDEEDVFDISNYQQVRLDDFFL